MDFFIKRGIIGLSEDRQYLTILNSEFGLLQFFGDIIQCMFDTYLTVLVGID